MGDAIEQELALFKSLLHLLDVRDFGARGGGGGGGGDESGDHEEVRGKLLSIMAARREQTRLLAQYMMRAQSDAGGLDAERYELKTQLVEAKERIKELEGRERLRAEEEEREEAEEVTRVKEEGSLIRTEMVELRQVLVEREATIAGLEAKTKDMNAAMNKIADLEESLREAVVGKRRLTLELEEQRKMCRNLRARLEAFSESENNENTPVSVARENLDAEESAGVVEAKVETLFPSTSSSDDDEGSIVRDGASVDDRRGDDELFDEASPLPLPFDDGGRGGERDDCESHMSPLSSSGNALIQQIEQEFSLTLPPTPERTLEKSDAGRERKGSLLASLFKRGPKQATSDSQGKAPQPFPLMQEYSRSPQQEPFSSSSSFNRAASKSVLDFSRHLSPSPGDMQISSHNTSGTIPYRRATLATLRNPLP